MKRKTPLAELMEERMIGTSDLSFITGINSLTVARYKRCDRPNAKNAAKIAAALSVKVEVLWPGKLRE